MKTQKTILDRENEVTDTQDPKMDARERIRDLAEFFNLPVYYDGTWTITFGDSGAVEYTGSEMGIDNRKPVVEGGGILEFMARDNIPQLIGQALINNRALKVIGIRENTVMIAVFGLTVQSKTYVLKSVNGGFERV